MQVEKFRIISESDYKMNELFYIHIAFFFFSFARQLWPLAVCCFVEGLEG